MRAHQRKTRSHVLRDRFLGFPRVLVVAFLTQRALTTSMNIFVTAPAASIRELLDENGRKQRIVGFGDFG